MPVQKHLFGQFIRKNIVPIIQAIGHAEANGAGKSGDEKLDMAVSFINGIIDIPILPEAVEAIIIRAAITAVVELAKALWGDTAWYAALSGHSSHLTA